MIYNDHLQNKELLASINTIVESTGTKEIEILTFLYTGGKEIQPNDSLRKNVGADKFFDSAIKSLSSKSYIVDSSRGYSITRKGVDYLLKKHPELEEGVAEVDDPVDEGLITKVAAVATGAAKLAKKGAQRVSKTGRADAAERRADKADRKAGAAERIRKAKQRQRDAKKKQTDESYITEKASRDDIERMIYMVWMAEDNTESSLEKEWGNYRTFQATLQRATKLGYLKKDGQSIFLDTKGRSFIKAMEE